MHLHELKPAPGAHRPSRRVGRGTGSGRGKTSGRGQKGQNARSEGFRLGFEGGQMPFSQRIPKLPGFKNPFKKIYSVVNVSMGPRSTQKRCSKQVSCAQGWTSRCWAPAA